MAVVAKALQGFREEQDALFCDLNAETAQAFFVKHGFAPKVEPVIYLAMAHKARSQSLWATDEMLADSMNWLNQHLELAKAVGGFGLPLHPIQRDHERMRRGMAPMLVRRVNR